MVNGSSEGGAGQNQSLWRLPGSTGWLRLHDDGSELAAPAACALLLRHCLEGAPRQAVFLERGMSIFSEQTTSGALLSCVRIIVTGAIFKPPACERAFFFFPLSPVFSGSSSVPVLSGGCWWITLVYSSLVLNPIHLHLPPRLWETSYFDIFCRLRQIL